MVIVKLGGGIGNQLYRYAAGRRLAHKWNTEFKQEIFEYANSKVSSYVLGSFNIQENFATAEEVQSLKQLHEGTNLGREKRAWNFMPEVLNWPDNLYLFGAWEDERYFADISDIIRKEFTLKNPLGAAAQRWKEKILAVDCSVSLHFRHGDFAFNPILGFSTSNAILPPDYYYECVNRLKREYKNLTLFVFSNNLQWVKENFLPGVPVEFVEGEDLQDFEELWLMSLCKHNIIANSTFSWWGAWLNRNPDKKVFMPIPSSEAARVGYRFSAVRNENSPLDSDRWIRVPFDINKQPKITMRPVFSLLLIVNDDAATLNETLGSILGQDYKFFELIIIDNASTDGSDKICQQFAKMNDKVTFISLHEKISDGSAHNKALDLAQGDFVIFLKGGDRLLVNALSSMYFVNETALVDIVNSVAWLVENDGGDISLAGKNFSVQVDAAFNGLQNTLIGKFDKLTLLKILAVNDSPTPLATKIFKRKFLANKKILFNENSEDIDLQFTVDALLKSEELIFVPQIFYIAPPSA